MSEIEILYHRDRRSVFTHGSKQAGLKNDPGESIERRDGRAVTQQFVNRLKAPAPKETLGGMG